MQGAFPYSTLKRFVSVIQNETKILMRRLKNEEGNKTFLIYPYLRDCAFDIINSEYLHSIQISIQMQNQNVR